MPADTYAHSFAVRIRIEVMPGEGTPAWHGQVENLLTREWRVVRSVDEIGAYFRDFLRSLGFEDEEGGLSPR